MLLSASIDDPRVCDVGMLRSASKPRGCDVAVGVNTQQTRGCRWVLVGVAAAASGRRGRSHDTLLSGTRPVRPGRHGSGRCGGTGGSERGRGGGGRADALPPQPCCHQVVALGHRPFLFLLRNEVVRGQLLTYLAATIPCGRQAAVLRPARVKHDACIVLVVIRLILC